MTKGGSLGRSGMWKSLTLSRHDAAGPAAISPASAGAPCPSLFSPMPPDRSATIHSQATNQLTEVHGDGRRTRRRKKKWSSSRSNACATAGERCVLRFRSSGWRHGEQCTRNACATTGRGNRGDRAVHAQQRQAGTVVRRARPLPACCFPPRSPVLSYARTRAEAEATGRTEKWRGWGFVTSG